MTIARPASPALGLSLRSRWDGAIDRAPPAHLEVLAESHLAPGAGRALRRRFPEATFHVHCVCVDIGTTDPPNAGLLGGVAALARTLEAATLSVHLSFSGTGGVAVDDLLPLPRTEATAAHCAGRVRALQARVDARVCVENVSHYVDPSPDAAMSEADFLAAVVERAGCGVLLDVNNLYVSAKNLSRDVARELAAVPMDAVEVLHVAGHEVWASGVRVDTHSRPPCPEVVALARRVSALRPVPCILEWDRDVPGFDEVAAALRALESGLEGRA
ncbi:MAG: DUF692 family multinuclear iron-containing protein [Myxococcota bacterium]